MIGQQKTARMRHLRPARLIHFFLLLGAIVSTSAAKADVVLLGSVAIPGTATDKSGLMDVLSDGTPHNRLGALGSGISYTGKGNRYILLPDRGPVDGQANYHCRVQFMDISLTLGGNPVLQANLVATTFLKTEAGQQLVGATTAFTSADPAKTLRFDPEGIRVSRGGSIFISDEYGPFIYEFTHEGKRLRSLKVPEKFMVKVPKADPKEELAANTSGRYPNRGLEGLAITPSGEKLLAAMQSPLIQDGGGDGTNNRLLEIELKTGATREFLYPLASTVHGLTEILAVNDHEFLVFERDHRKGAKAKFKWITKIDISGATDISGMAALPRTEIPAGVTPVKKELCINLLDPKFGLAGPDLPEKIEGLAFGPDLPDGRHLLLVTSDNDFIATQPTYIYAFAIDKKDLPSFQPQVFRK